MDIPETWFQLFYQIFSTSWKIVIRHFLQLLQPEGIVKSISLRKAFGKTNEQKDLVIVCSSKSLNLE
jgi:hypothetical protein